MSYPFFFKPYSLHLNYSQEGKVLDTQAMGEEGPRVAILDGGGIQQLSHLALRPDGAKTQMAHLRIFAG
jgi:hypothetical protein